MVDWERWRLEEWSQIGALRESGSMENSVTQSRTSYRPGCLVLKWRALDLRCSATLYARKPCVLSSLSHIPYSLQCHDLRTFQSCCYSSLKSVSIRWAVSSDDSWQPLLLLLACSNWRASPRGTQSFRPTLAILQCFSRQISRVLPMEQASWDSSIIYTGSLWSTAGRRAQASGRSRQW